MKESMLRLGPLYSNAYFLCLFLFSISLSDFFRFYYNYFIVVPFLFLSFIGFIFVLSTKVPLLKEVVGYFFAICILYLYGSSFSSGYSYLVFIPIASYLSVIIWNRRDNIFISISGVVKVLLFAFSIFGGIELLVKLNILHLNYLSDFIINYGDGRIDVLRMRSFFGSPLSAAAICIFFAFFFIYFEVSVLYLSLAFFLAILTGSRTGVILIVLMCLSNPARLSFMIKRIGYLGIFAIFLSLVASFYFMWDYMSDIFLRAFSLSFDESFQGRSNTTLDSISKIYDVLPISLFQGIPVGWISDSAVVSIAAESGVLTAVLFVSYFIFNISDLRSLSLWGKTVLITLFILCILVIGDFFVPMITYLFFLVFYADRAFSLRG